MTHDPLCPMHPGYNWLEEENYCCGSCNPGAYIPWEPVCICKSLARVREDEREKHADCRCNELEAMAIVDGKYESVAINGQLLERRDVVLDEAREAVAAKAMHSPKCFALLPDFDERDCNCAVAYSIAAIDALKEKP